MWRCTRHSFIGGAPLSNDGFRSDWANLTERFENQRLLVSNQLKILFNVQSVNQESGSAIRELQRTIQGCLTAFDRSGIQTEWWINSYETSPKDVSFVRRKPFCPHMCTISPDDIKRKQLCLNCFARGHQLRDCKNTHSCFTCRGHRHTLLHRGNSYPAPSNPSPRPRSWPNTPVATATGSDLLGTAIIDIFLLGSNFKARALIDSGSEAFFISERLFKLIKLPHQVIQAQVSGLSQTVSAESKSSVSLPFVLRTGLAGK